jgi:hypothetical protein
MVWPNADFREPWFSFAFCFANCCIWFSVSAVFVYERKASMDSFPRPSLGYSFNGICFW